LVRPARPQPASQRAALERPAIPRRSHQGRRGSIAGRCVKRPAGKAPAKQDAPKRSKPRKGKPGSAKGKTAKPVLLSGGNPQIAKGYGDAPVEAYLSAMPGWKRNIGRRLDALVTPIVPSLRKAVKWNSPFYGAADE